MIKEDSIRLGIKELYLINESNNYIYNLISMSLIV